jgi:hypothetical protein
MKKTIYLLLGILVVFIILYLLLVQKEKRTFSVGKTENFLDLDSAAVDRIEFSKYGTKLALQKQNQMWYLTEPDVHRAEYNAVGRLLSLSSHLEVGELISSNPEKQYWFQVDTLTGTVLNFFSQEDILASVVLGKISDDRIHAYLRQTSSNDVYLAPVDFIHLTQQSINQWRARRIFTFDAEQIREIEFNYEPKSFKLVKEDTLWQLSRYPYREILQIDLQTAEEYVRTLANMRADNFPFRSQIEGLEFETGEPLLKIILQDGNEVRLFAIKSLAEENQYFVKTDQDRSVFILFEYNFKQLNKKPDDFQSKQES